MANERKQFMVEDAQLIYRNFRGEATPYNKEGSRNFCVVLDQATAEIMAKDGWNVKWPKPRPEMDEEEETRNPYIKVNVGYKVRPPKIVMITSTARTMLTEETVSVLDWADIEKVDLIAVASYWEAAGSSGIAPYVKSMFVFVEEDELEKKYAHLMVDEGNMYVEEPE